MAIFKCKMCGGALEINNNETVATCECCGTRQTLPKLEDDRRINLYDRTNHFRRNTYALVWAQALLGGVLFAGCWPPLTHGIFAVLTIAAMLCIHKRNTRGARVFARVVVSFFWAWLCLLAVQSADILVQISNGHLTTEHIARLQDGVCWFGGMFLCYLTPTAVATMLYHSEHTAAYDRMMGCLLLPVAAGAAYVSIFTGANIAWTIGGKFLPYIWLALVVIATVATWLAARAHTPAQQAAIDRRAEKHKQRIEAKKAK